MDYFSEAGGLHDVLYDTELDWVFKEMVELSHQEAAVATPSWYAENKATSFQ
jgi:hypothetical protein